MNFPRSSKRLLALPLSLILSASAAPAAEAPTDNAPVDNAPAAPTVAGTSAAGGSQRTSPVLPAPDPGSELADLIRSGGTMEEVAKLRDPIARTPAEAIRALKTGNARFYGGVARRPEASANERRAQILSQTPFAIVLGCSDSRVPTEIVFDQGLGSLFITRVAGNVIEPGTVGSVEYAVNHLKSHLVVVLGHEGCGAVKAAMLPAAQRNREAQGVRYLLDRVLPSVQAMPPIRDEKARVREGVIANVRLQTNIIMQNPTIKAAIARGQIKVIGAYYEIGSGAVDFLESPEDLNLTPQERARAASLMREAASSEVGHAH